METPDVSVLIRAFRQDSAGHRSAAAWLSEAIEGHRRVAVSSLALSAMIRIVSHPGMLKVPEHKADVMAFAKEIANHTNVEVISPGRRHWDIFVSLIERPGVRGKVVPDAYYAAMAIERGLTFVTADRGFGRFPGLRWRLLE